MSDKETWIKQITDICEMAYEEGYEAGRKSNAMTLSTDGTFTAPSQSFLSVAMMAWAHDHEIDKKREYERGYNDGYETAKTKGEGNESRAKLIMSIHKLFDIPLSDATNAYDLIIEYFRLKSNMGDHPEKCKPREYILVEKKISEEQA
jgi:hypothetical protein